jgi:hypothetical protein
MWVIPGEPVTAVAVPLWVEAGASPEPLWQGEKAPLWVESARLKKLARPFDEGNKGDYLKLTALDNAAGTGFLPGLLEAERAIIAETDAFLSQPHSADEYREFQDRMAVRALAAMFHRSRWNVRKRVVHRDEARDGAPRLLSHRGWTGESHSLPSRATARSKVFRSSGSRRPRNSSIHFR